MTGMDLPAMVMDPDRAMATLFGAADTLTVLEPDPVAPPVMPSHDGPARAVHEQEDGSDTATVRMPPALSKASESGSTIGSVQDQAG